MTKIERQEMNKRIYYLGILLIALLFISFLSLVVKSISIYQTYKQTEPAIFTPTIAAIEAPITTEKIELTSYAEAKHPCYLGYQKGFEHSSLHWGECTRCGEFIPRYGFTEEEIYLLAQLLCGDEKIDGDGEYDFAWFPVYGMDIRYDQISLVLNVVMNRVRSEHGGNATVTDVVLASGQFHVFPRNLNTTPAEIAIEKVREWCEAYDRWDPGVQSIPENHLYFCAGPDLTNVSREHWR